MKKSFVDQIDKTLETNSKLKLAVSSVLVEMAELRQRNQELEKLRDLLLDDSNAMNSADLSRDSSDLHAEGGENRNLVPLKVAPHKQLASISQQPYGSPGDANRTETLVNHSLGEENFAGDH